MCTKFGTLLINLFLEDPVRIFDHEPAPPHSLLKLFIDLFSRRSTSDLFYTNDVKVLIDIIVRNISDLSTGDSVRYIQIQMAKYCLKIKIMLKITFSVCCYEIEFLNR